MEMNYDGRMQILPESMASVAQIKRLRGHLVGLVELVDIPLARDVPADDQGRGWITPGLDPDHHRVLRLESPRLLRSPIAVRGRLGFFYPK